MSERIKLDWGVPIWVFITFLLFIFWGVVHNRRIADLEHRIMLIESSTTNKSLKP